MKRIEDLKTGDIIYQYGIGNLPDRGDFVFKRKLEIDNSYMVTKRNDHAIGFEYFSNEQKLRHTIKSNEGKMYRNTFWLSEEDDKLAKEIMVKYLNRNIEIALHQIKTNRNRISMVSKFFKK